MLERPDIPLHTNGSENDICCQVTKRGISGGTRSDAGRDCRGAFLALLKTCAKNRFEFWDYLGARLAFPGCQDIPRPRTSRPRARSYATMTAGTFAPVASRPWAPAVMLKHSWVSMGGEWTG